MLENLSHWLASVKDFLGEKLVDKDLLEGSLELDQTDIDVDHSEVFLTVELLAKDHVSWV